MRRLVWLGAIFALMWSGWWYFAATSLQSSVTQWFEERRAEGWQADMADTRIGGYPLALGVTLERPALADPQTGVAFETTALEITAPAWWPGYVTLAFPSEDVIFANPQGRQVVRATAAQADLRLRPGTNLQVEEMALTSGPWSLTAAAGSVMAAGGLTLRMLQTPGTAEQYDFTLDAPAFEPGSLPRAALRVPADWPLAFDSLALDMTVLFDRPIDQSTLEEARPQPRRVDLRLAEAVWGTLALRSAAQLDVSDAGLLNGAVSLQARNWRGMLELAETAGALPASLRPQIENILGALARGGGNPDTLDLELTLRDGTAFIGFIPLGPAPRLILR